MQLWPDDKWVVYTTSSNKKFWRVPVDGGTALPVTVEHYFTWDTSPNGRLIAYYQFTTDANPPCFQIVVAAADKELPLKVFNMPPGVNGSGMSPRWTMDNRAVTYIETRGGVSNIWSQLIDGGPAKQLTDFKSNRIDSYDWSHDGKQLAVARGYQTSDVVVIRDWR